MLSSFDKTNLFHARLPRERTRQYRRIVRDKHPHLTTNQIGRQRRQAIKLTLPPAIFDRHVLALDMAGVGEALPERRDKRFVCCCRCAAEEADYRYRRLLRGCCARRWGWRAHGHPRDCSTRE